MEMVTASLLPSKNYISPLLANANLENTPNTCSSGISDLYKPPRESGVNGQVTKRYNIACLFFLTMVLAIIERKNSNIKENCNTEGRKENQKSSFYTKT